jgi:hypothetical protein
MENVNWHSVLALRKAIVDMLLSDVLGICRRDKEIGALGWVEGPCVTTGGDGGSNILSRGNGLKKSLMGAFFRCPGVCGKMGAAGTSCRIKKVPTVASEGVECACGVSGSRLKVRICTARGVVREIDWVPCEVSSSESGSIHSSWSSSVCHAGVGG